MFSCAPMGVALSVSLCFAQGNRDDAGQELQRLQDITRLVTAPPETAKPLVCDSLAPEVCFDIYQRRMERAQERMVLPSAADSRCQLNNSFGDLPCRAAARLGQRQ
jgi:hypothetical protein